MIQMTLEEFDELPQNARELFFNYMWELYDISNRHPASNDDIKILVEWHDRMGIFGHGETLEQHLNRLSAR